MNDSDLLSHIEAWLKTDLGDPEIEAHLEDWMKSRSKSSRSSPLRNNVTTEQNDFAARRVLLKTLSGCSEGKLPSLFLKCLERCEFSSRRSHGSVWSRCGNRFSFDTFGNGRYSYFEPPVVSGEGEIWKAIDEHSRQSSSNAESLELPSESLRVVALKRVRQDLLLGHDVESIEKRILQEGIRASLLEHPNICPVYDVFHGSKTQPPFYVMRFLGGDTLATAIQAFHNAQPLNQYRKSDWAKLIRILVDACSAVSFAHSKAIAHLDLKPTNIMIGDQGETQVIDWGMSSPLRPDGLVSVERHATGNFDSAKATAFGVRYDYGITGTPAYCAPEQIIGKPSGSFTDVFQLGAVLYEILTGAAPFAGPNHELSVARAALLAKKNLFDRQSFPHLRRHQLVDLAAIAEKAMCKCPEDRYPTVQLLQADLEAWLTDEPVTARRPSILDRSARHTRRNFAAVSIACLSIALMPFIAAAPFFYEWMAYQRESVEYYRQVVDSIHGPIGAHPMRSEDIGRCYSAIEATRKGWYGPIVKLRVVDRFRNTHWEEGVRNYLQSEWNDDSEDQDELASEIEYSYREGLIDLETARNFHGQQIWQIAYEPLTESTWWAEVRYRNHETNSFSIQRLERSTKSTTQQNSSSAVAQAQRSESLLGLDKIEQRATDITSSKVSVPTVQPTSGEENKNALKPINTEKPRDGVFKRAGVNSFKIDVDDVGRFETIRFKENSETGERQDGVYGIRQNFDPSSGFIVKTEYYYDPDLDANHSLNKDPSVIRFVEQTYSSTDSARQVIRFFDFIERPINSLDGFACSIYSESPSGWRIDFQDREGKAPNPKLQMASVVAEFKGHNTTEIQYLDGNGQPIHIETDSAARMIVEHGPNITLQYVGFAEKAELSRYTIRLTDDESVEEFCFRDAKKDHIATSRYKDGYLRQVEFTRDGKYFADDSSSYSRVTYANYDDGRPLSEVYEGLDSNGNMVTLHSISRSHDRETTKQLGLLDWHNDAKVVSQTKVFYISNFDVQGNNEYERERAYFDPSYQDKPVIGPDGWHRFERSWYENTGDLELEGKVLEERYFGIENDILWSYSFNYDRESSEPLGILRRSRLLPDGRLSRLEVLLNDQLVEGSHEFAAAEIKYSSEASDKYSGTETWHFFDADEKPCTHADGHDQLEKTFELGVLKQKRFHNVQTELTIPFYGVEVYRDDGKLERIHYLNESNQRIPNPTTSIYEVRFAYDMESSRLLRSEYFNADGEHIYSPDYAAEVVYHYALPDEEYPRTVVYRGFDPTLYGYQAFEQRYDQFGNITSTRYLDAHGNLTRNSVSLAAEVRNTYSEDGSCLLRTEFLDEFSNLSRRADLESSIEYRYHPVDKQLLTSKMYRGFDQNLFGASGVEDHYDSEGRLVEKFFLNEKDQRVTNTSSGIFRRRFVFEEGGTSRSESYDDADRLLVGVAKVLSLEDDSPAEKAGILAGDLLIECNDIAITYDNFSELKHDLLESGNRSSLAYTVLRDQTLVKIVIQVNQEKLLGIQFVEGSITEETYQRLTATEVQTSLP